MAGNGTFGKAFEVLNEYFGRVTRPSHNPAPETCSAIARSSKASTRRSQTIKIGLLQRKILVVTKPY